MFVRNAWYVAAYASEVGAAPLARTLLDQPMVLYRRTDGRPVVLEDRCCHRSLPLSMGKVIGDRLQCGYHGLEFDPTGACVRVPGQTTVPPGARVGRWPAVERWGFVWVWPGAADAADPALIPDWHWLGDPGWMVNHGALLPLACSYELVTDNLQDLSHLSYVHTSSIGNDAILDFPVRTERTGDMVRMTRWIPDRPPPPLYARVGNYDGPVDRWQVVETTPPAFTIVHAGCAPAGLTDRKTVPAHGVHVKVLNAPTPQTERSCIYFYAHAFNFGQGDAALKQDMFDTFLKIFQEDIGIMEAQQAVLDRDPAAPQIDINVDAPGIACRRMVRERMAAESQGARA